MSRGRDLLRGREHHLFLAPPARLGDSGGLRWLCVCVGNRKVVVAHLADFVAAFVCEVTLALWLIIKGVALPASRQRQDGLE